jgi:serine/threonine-protein kinase RsbW
LDSAAIYAVETAVDEACTNIIEHAYEAEGVGDIQCTCQVDSDRLTIILIDHGKSFDPDKIQDPDLTVPLEERQSNGLGLFFIRRFMDEVHFQFIPGKENILTLVKRKEKKI